MGIGTSSSGSRIGAGKLRTPSGSGIGLPYRSDSRQHGRADQSAPMSSQRPLAGERPLPRPTPAQGHSSPSFPLDRLSPKDW
jgi:hypothetical protein